MTLFVTASANDNPIYEYKVLFYAAPPVTPKWKKDTRPIGDFVTSCFNLIGRWWSDDQNIRVFDVKVEL